MGGWKSAGALALGILVTGCSQPKASTPIPDPALTSRIDALEKRLTEQESENRKLALRVDGSVFLRRGDDGFSTATSSVGPLTLRMTGIGPDGSGSRISLEIGSPSAATISELRVVGQWGAVDADGYPARDAHDFTTTIKSPVLSGHWNKATLIIDGAKPTDLGYIQISELTANNIRLTAPN